MGVSSSSNLWAASLQEDRFIIIPQTSYLLISSYTLLHAAAALHDDAFESCDVSEVKDKSHLLQCGSYFHSFIIVIGLFNPVQMGLTLQRQAGNETFTVLIVLDGILTISKLQDMVCNRRGHTTRQSQKRKLKSSPGGHGRVEGEAWRDVRKRYCVR